MKPRYIISFLKKIDGKIKRETKIIFVTLILMFVIESFSGIAQYIVNNGYNKIDAISMYFNDIDNTNQLILDCGFATVIVSVFTVILSYLSERKSVSFKASFVICLALIFSILWYVFAPILEKTWVTFSISCMLMSLVLIAYILLVQRDTVSVKIRNSDSIISGITYIYGKEN